MHKTMNEILQSSFYWPTIFKDVHRFYTKCLQCQTSSKISKRNEMRMWLILEVEIFNLWGIDFMGPFPPSDAKEYILVAVDYVSKWLTRSPLGETTIGRCFDLLRDASSPGTVVREPSSATAAHTSIMHTSRHF